MTTTAESTITYYVEWWNNLPEEWKSALMPTCRLLGDIDDPARVESTIARLHQLDTLNIGYTTIRSLEPISVFKHLKNINISGCHQLESLEHMPTSIEYICMFDVKFDNYDILLHLRHLDNVSADRLLQNALNRKLTLRRIRQYEVIEF